MCPCVVLVLNSKDTAEMHRYVNICDRIQKIKQAVLVFCEVCFSVYVKLRSTLFLLFNGRHTSKDVTLLSWKWDAVYADQLRADANLQWFSGSSLGCALSPVPFVANYTMFHREKRETINESEPKITVLQTGCRFNKVQSTY